MSCLQPSGIGHLLVCPLIMLPPSRLHNSSSVASTTHLSSDCAGSLPHSSSQFTPHPLFLTHHTNRWRCHRGFNRLNTPVCRRPSHSRAPCRHWCCGHARPRRVCPSAHKGPEGQQAHKTNVLLHHAAAAGTGTRVGVGVDGRDEEGRNAGEWRYRVSS